jgi:outer membrane protein TolC
MSSLLSARVFRSWIACCGAASLSACSVGPDFQLPETGLPKSYLAGVNTSKTVPASELVAGVNLTQWWRSFRDPQLVSLVERSIAANPDIAIALARLQQARAQQFVAIGAALPSGEPGAAPYLMTCKRRAYSGASA